MRIHFRNKKLILYTIQIFILSFPITVRSSTIAQTPYQRVVRIFESHEFGLSDLSGLVFLPEANAFLSISASGPSGSILSLISFSGNLEDIIKFEGSIVNPLNMSFDNNENKLLYFDTRTDEIIEMQTGPNQHPDFSIGEVSRSQLQHLGLHNVQGMSVDPGSGDLYILDAQVPRIVHIILDSGNRFDSISALEDRRISIIEISSLKGIELRGIAYNNFDGHFYITSPNEKILYEINNEGQIISWRDLDLWNYTDTDGLLFAPSGDRTDDPSINNLYIVDTGLNSGGGGIVELSLVQPERLDLSDITVRASSFKVRSLNSRVAASNEPSDLLMDAIPVNTILTSLWSPPSPDPAGAAFFPPSNNLLITDSEVNEMPIFTGVNIFESTFSGSVVNTSSSTSFSNEPTGIAYNPDNGHFFISDDVNREVYEIAPGNDGIIGTLDDIITFFDTLLFSSNDPEGIAFDNWQGHLFLVDGVNTEIYEIDPGSNGVFDGAPPDGDDVINSFDTNILGLTDPEGVEFNSINGHLYIVSGKEDIIVETTTLGVGVRVIDVSFLNARAMAGLAHAPSSGNSGGWSLYIVDRGVDNNSDPNENDGKMYEITDEDISLPVELSNFTADLFEDNVRLEWITESEMENIGFELMRSEEEKGYYTLITSYIENIDLVGQGNSSTHHLYSYIDEGFEPGKTYWYRLIDIDVYGKRTVHGPVSISTTQANSLPVSYKMHPNYPNPFNPITTIKVEVPISNSGPIDISLVIYNTLGQLVKTLSEDRLSPGTYDIPWDSTTDYGHQAPAGIYYARLRFGAFSQSIKMILLK